MSIRCWAVIWICGAGLASAQEGWTVDGLWLGAPAERVPHQLKSNHLGPGWLEWEAPGKRAYDTQFVIIAPGIGVVRCAGRELRLAGRLITKADDAVGRLTTMLGKPERTSGALGHCYEDPCQWNHYKRDGAVVSVLISNDEFIRRRVPKAAWPKYLSRVWSVALTRRDFPTLLENARKMNGPSIRGCLF